MTADDLEILAEMELVNEQARRLISDHLDRYIRRIGSEATFEGWIGILHPENCTLDNRLTFPDSDHLRLWNEREGVRAAIADSDGTSFWKGVGSLANEVATRMSKKVAVKAKPEEGTAAAVTASNDIVETPAPSLDDAFGGLFARAEARGSLGHGARTVSEVDVELKKTMDDLFAKRPPQQPALEPRAPTIPGALPSLSTSLLDDLFARPPAAPASSQNPFA
jgi:hypothetical protein